MAFGVTIAPVAEEILLSLSLFPKTLEVWILTASSRPSGATPWTTRLSLPCLIGGPSRAITPWFISRYRAICERSSNNSFQMPPLQTRQDRDEIQTNLRVAVIARSDGTLFPSVTGLLGRLFAKPLIIFRAGGPRDQKASPTGSSRLRYFLDVSFTQ